MGTALGFQIAKLLRNETALSEFSVSPHDLFTELSGRSVAIVGNSRGLAETTFGADIDGADLIIRMNRAPMPDATSHGTRTDWLALATSLSSEEERRIAPKRVLWMSHKRKRLPYRIAQQDGFYLHPLSEWKRLTQAFRSPPSTGAMIVDLVASSNAARIDIFGFDFFQTKSLSGRRSADQVPHDFDAEQSFVTTLCETDPRITVRK